MPQIKDIIANNRKKKKWSQIELSRELEKEVLSIDHKIISKWERGISEPGASVFLQLCRVLDITNIYEAFFGINPSDPISSLSEAGKEKVLDYIHLLHASGLYEKKVCKVIPFRRKISIYESKVSAGLGNFLEDGPFKEIEITDSAFIPENASFGVYISGDSMMPDFENGQIAWVHKQETLENGEIGVFSFDGEAYIKKLRDDNTGISLISLNKKYAPKVVNENSEFHIFGKVVGKSVASTVFCTD